MVSYPVVAFLGEGGLEDGLEEFAGVVEVFLGLGGGRRDPLKGFIQDPHDPLLLGKGRDGKLNFFDRLGDMCFTGSLLLCNFLRVFRSDKKETWNCH